MSEPPGLGKQIQPEQIDPEEDLLSEEQLAAYLQGEVDHSEEQEDL